MFDMFMTAFSSACSLEALVANFIGVALGIVFGALPGLTAVMGVALLSLILVGRTITGKDKDTACWPERKLAVKVGLMAAWILAYVVGFIFLGEYAYDAEWPEGTGFLISTLIFLSGAQVLTGYRNPFYIFLISAGISAFLYAVFAIFFKVPLP